MNIKDFNDVMSEQEQLRTNQIAKSKTPVSLLQELCEKKGVSPKYDLVQVEGQGHNPAFQYQVTVGDFSASGTSGSKKKAKQVAAKVLLDKLIDSQRSGSISPGHPMVPEHMIQILSQPSEEEGIDGNPLNDVQEIVKSRRWAPATYHLTHEEGLPNGRTFTMMCVIENRHTEDKYIEYGSGMSKKIAKRHAAQNMVERLRETPRDLEEDDGIAQGRGLGKKELKWIHKSLKNAKGEAIGQLRNHKLTSKERILPDESFESLLEQVAKELNIKVTYAQVEEISKSGKYQCFVQLSTSPTATCIGSGSSRDAARESCAMDALQYLQCMLY